MSRAGVRNCPNRDTGDGGYTGGKGCFIVVYRPEGGGRIVFWRHCLQRAGHFLSRSPRERGLRRRSQTGDRLKGLPVQRGPLIAAFRRLPGAAAGQAGPLPRVALPRAVVVDELAALTTLLGQERTALEEPCAPHVPRTRRPKISGRRSPLSADTQRPGPGKNPRPGPFARCGLEFVSAAAAAGAGRNRRRSRSAGQSVAAPGCSASVSAWRTSARWSSPYWMMAPMTTFFGRRRP